MLQTILLILAILIIILLLTRKGREAAVGICNTALDQTVRKNANKQNITALLKDRGALSNKDIREALGISERSVVRYMNQLEKDGLAEQVGERGRNVRYRLK